MALGRGETLEAQRLGREAAEIARGIERPDLEAMGLALEGHALVAEGQVDGWDAAARRGNGDGDREWIGGLRLRRADVLHDAGRVRAHRRHRASERVV